MSAIGSVIVMSSRQPFSPWFPAKGLRRSGISGGGLPRGLRHTGQLTTVSHLPDADPAETELAVDRLGTPAALATGVRADRELRLRGSLEDQRLLSHLSVLLA